MVGQNSTVRSEVPKQPYIGAQKKECCCFDNTQVENNSLNVSYFFVEVYTNMSNGNNISKVVATKWKIKGGNSPRNQDDEMKNTKRRQQELLWNDQEISGMNFNLNKYTPTKINTNLINK